MAGWARALSLQAAAGWRSPHACGGLVGDAALRRQGALLCLPGVSLAVDASGGGVLTPCLV